MKIYKQILAGFLAMNLVVSGMPTRTILTYADEETGSVDIEDSSFYDLYNETEMSSTALYSEENIGTQTEENTQPLPVDTEAETTPIVPTESSSTLETAASSSAVESSTENVAIEQPTDQTTGQVPESTIENTTKDTETVESSEIQSSEESTESISEESTEEITTEEETEEESTEEESTEEVEDQIELFSARDGQEYLNIEALDFYSNGTATINGNDNDSAYQLILLSYCDPTDLKNITIELKTSGNLDITKANNISNGTDITRFFKTSNIISNVSENLNDDLSEEETKSENLDQVDDGIIEEVQLNDDQTVVDKIIATHEYSFQGIGSEAVPFQGKITGSQPTLKIDRTFFGGLSSLAIASIDNKTFFQVNWCGDGSQPMAADVYQFDSNNEKEYTLPIKVIGDSSAKMGSLLGTVQLSAEISKSTLKIDNNAVEYKDSKGDTVNVAVEVSNGNAGLICNTLKSGTISLDGYQLPASYTVKATAQYNKTDETTRAAAGNAGGLIGVVAENAALQVNSEITIPTEVSITSENGNAGGLIGLMQKGAKIITNKAITLSSLKISGGTSSGGLVGCAENVLFEDSDRIEKIKVENPTITGSKSEASVGGFIGTYILNENALENQTELQFPENIEISSPTLTVNQSNTGTAGGYFGYLEFQGKIKYTIGSNSQNNKKDFSGTIINSGFSAEACGAIAGKVTSTTIESTLLIQNMSVQEKNNGGNGVKYHGGLIGELGNAGNETNPNSTYLEVNNVEVKVINPTTVNQFGGLVGYLAYGSILKTENIVTVSTPDDQGTACGSEINVGGGLVGYAEKSVIALSGVTDLSGTGYKDSQGKAGKTGWLVGQQDSALIYVQGDGNGSGWSYIRGKEKTSGKVAMNDIGNYGQVIRLKSVENTVESELSKLSYNLINISDNHTVSFSKTIDSTDEITIDSEDDFALVSIAWNTRGQFSAISGLTKDNFSTFGLQSKTFKLNNNIDLTGSGITGLTRDMLTNNGDDNFSGIFEGNNKQITLSIGEVFGFKQDDKTILAGNQADNDDDGYGEVIAADGNLHNRQGLFARNSGGTVQNLTVKGTINISNAGRDMLAGGIAGDSVGNSILLNVTVSETIDADCVGNQVLAVGGFYGGCYSGEPKFGTYNQADTLSTSSAIINIQNCPSGTEETKIYAGGLIGEANGMTKLKAHCVKVTGIITSKETAYAYVGGLVGIIRKSSGTVWVEIKNVTFEGFQIQAQNVAKICGGLFGSIWQNVGVYFMGSDDKNDGTNTKLTVGNTTINAPQAEYVGGLAYRSSGRWEIRSNGINLQSLTIEAKKNVGLLVCRGEKGKEKIAGTNTDLDALYLNTTKYWNSETESSYKISDDNVSITTNQTGGVFDEFVAYTAAAANQITTNGQNGIISIATEEKNGTRVGIDVSGCTSYQNRTTYGKSHTTNGCSRYYYDLDQCIKDMTNGGVASYYNNNGKLDTPQELLLWSVYYYACENIKSYFIEVAIGSTLYEIPDIKMPAKGPYTITSGLPLDMKKYSYYPINYTKSSVTLSGVALTFYNQEIEIAEKGANDKKITQGTNDKHTQHYTMHCGLFLNYQPGPGTLTVNGVTLSGTVGMINSSTSGALIAGKTNGYLGTTDNKVRTIGITIIGNTILDNLKITNYTENSYAPLLINEIGSYVNLNVTGLTTRKSAGNDSSQEVNTYTEGTAIASSLIGKVGGASEQQINLTFLNVVLPDKKVDESNGIFSRATLLDSYAYKEGDNTSNATYNFYSTDDWNENNHIHKVTYGKEITETTEFIDSQKWYYDDELHGKDVGLVYDDSSNKTFTAGQYLPYVYTAYDETKSTHEIKVNQRVTNITDGCGTYGHPYKITSEKEMEILSEYMSTGTPRVDWKVTITRNQATYHVDAGDNSTNDATYKYNGTDWVQVQKATGTNNWTEVTGTAHLGKDFMRQYLLNAYYDLQGSKDSFNLEDFPGFGTADNPFRGVLTSSTGVTINMSGANTGNGLIPYSAGSVVRNIKINYQLTGKILTYSSTRIYYPDVCFGGVIGCVLGGDNIIENVTVTIADNWLTLSESQKHLLQVGGYVGAVSGGGVIFRNMTDDSGLSDRAVKNVSGIHNDTETKNLYVNPYVGRVMDGFAVYEKTSDAAEGTLTSLNNTNKNYTITSLKSSGTACIFMNGDTVTVNDDQGLFVLSAIVNSGAASNGISNAYNKLSNTQNTTVDKVSYQFGGRYGKVRNARYNEIGTTGSDTEAASSKADDQTVPGENSLPYLIQSYCGRNSGLFGISTNSNVEIQLKTDGSFDMTSYQNGYQGIGARYVSSAVQGITENSENVASTDVHPEGIVPELKKFNGNKKSVLMDMQVKEYIDDDFHAASVGGLFNILRVSGRGLISALTIGSETGSSIGLQYYDANGSEASVSGWSNNTEVGLGGFAGSLVGYTAENTDNNPATRDITVENIQINKLTVNSPASAGGIFGNTGKIAASYENDIGKLLQPKEHQILYGITFDNCSYTSLAITGVNAAGGFVGYIGRKNTTGDTRNPACVVNGKASTSENDNANVTGSSSTIKGKGNASYAGGLFGYVGTRMFINMDQNGNTQKKELVLQNVTVNAGKAAGGIIGSISEENSNKTQFAGRCYGIYNATVTDANIKLIDDDKKKGTFYAGGIIGYAKGEVQGWETSWINAGGIISSTVINVTINDNTYVGKHDYSTNNSAIQTNYEVGGMVGYTGGGITKIDSCVVSRGGIYGSAAGGIVGWTESELHFTNCEVKGMSSEKLINIQGFSTAGGFLGFWKGGKNIDVQLQRCKLQYSNLEGRDWGSGALIGDADGGGVGTLYLFDTSVQDSIVKAAGNENKAGGRWPCVGAIIGNLRNSVKASNILISEMELSASKGSQSSEKYGLLFGAVNGDPSINIAGISIQNIDDNNSKWSLAGSGTVTTNNDYIAFADYSGSANPSATIADSNPPYVVTSPVGNLSVSENNVDKQLYGDGVSWEINGSGDDASFSVKAETIWENRNEVTNGHYAYKNIGITGEKETAFSVSSLMGSYNNNQTNKATTDFPVLQISSGKVDSVIDYLNILTNGGYSAANSNTNVTATAVTYTYQDGKFIKAVNEDGSAVTPSLIAVTDETTKRISFETTTEYDNDKDRFTLLTVTFTEKDKDSVEHKYIVTVPVLVRRKLEVDVSITLTYGTDFRSQDYLNLQSHVLESFGNSVTGYLTYTYNSAEGEYTDYGWQSYINAGGDVANSMGKVIEFVQGTNFPVGTQFTLVDCKDAKSYYYTTESETKEIKLSDFAGYQEPSIAEVLGATAVDKGDFIEVDETGKPVDDTDGSQVKKPTVRIKDEGGSYKYYRKAEGNTEKGKYSIQVNEASFVNGVTSNLKECYYLVITVPKSDSSSQSAINGSIQTRLDNIKNVIPSQLYYRKIGGGEDPQSNSASTYVFLSGYDQTLSEGDSITSNSKLVSISDPNINVDIVDSITFSDSQLYNASDQLYLRFVAGLQKTEGDATSAEVFPAGTIGTVQFYVYTETNNAKQYYSYANGTWQNTSSENAAASYDWVSDGGNMELILSTDGSSENAISLQRIRDEYAKNSNKFYVRAKISATIPASGMQTIPESELNESSLPVNYVKLSYSSQLSTEEQSLAYSNNRGTYSSSQTRTAYYRQKAVEVSLTYEADLVGQLGINLLDLQSEYLDVEKTHSLIDTTAVYDLSNIEKLDDVLKNSNGMKFTLTLQQKSTGNEAEIPVYNQSLANANEYMNVEVKSSNSGSATFGNGAWTWTVPKSTYWDEATGKLVSNAVFNGTVLTQIIQLKVNVTNVEQLSHYYSNYRVVLNVEILDADGKTVEGTGDDDNIIYTLAKIKPEFIEGDN